MSNSLIPSSVKEKLVFNRIDLVVDVSFLIIGVVLVIVGVVLNKNEQNVSLGFFIFGGIVSTTAAICLVVHARRRKTIQDDSMNMHNSYI